MRYTLSLFFLLISINSIAQYIGDTRREIILNLQDSTYAGHHANHKHFDGKLIAIDSSCSGKTEILIFLEHNIFGEYCDSVNIKFEEKSCLDEYVTYVLKEHFREYYQLASNTFICSEADSKISSFLEKSVYDFKIMTISEVEDLRLYMLILNYKRLTKKEFKKLTRNSTRR